ncbi:hypothetical protein HPS57_08500 [Prevotella sp. PINT]|jgi:hypothetical protein|uniref:hypothetical protein n=1 Tax=Palleniella intestinalis TaxID=2736291 RepID=UPI001556B6E6|nr:hypothetical protein [Palleniella intestinalis]NPD82013.1 hypothetical protein [Palleniella intestinalis]
MNVKLLCNALLAAALCGASLPASAADGKVPNQGNKYVFHSTGNPYLPLWEHVPDGEPRVFEDPDNPGKYRVYIIGSHDVRYDSYCGPDIRAWSAPVEDLSQWRDDGPIFTYSINNQWDVMYAPDLVCVKGKDGKKTYYLYPHSRGWGREAMVCKGDRPDGPFTPINMTKDGQKTLDGSFIGFDPSVYVEQIEDTKDPDYDKGFRAYVYWGYQRSSAAQLDQNTMWSVRPGTEIIPYFMPAGTPDGGIRDPKGTEYPCLFKGENPAAYNFYEASSIRKVGNKYVTVYSGFSGAEYGIGISNSTLRYAYADSPLGPWKSGGVLVDSRAPVLNEDGTKIKESYAAHNTHGSIEQINGQWYVFYHRPPRGYMGTRQSVVAPIHVVCDQKPVSKGGKVVIKAFDPYVKGGVTVKAADGNEYRGAEITSEGFHVYGMDPYRYYSAGIACYLSDIYVQGDSWDIWNDHAPIVNLKNGNIVGYKYFGFGGLQADKLGLKAFEGTKKGNNTQFNLFLTPKTDKAFKVSVWLDGPYANKAWKGKKLGEINVPANAAKKATRFTLDVSSVVDNLGKKHGIYLVAEGAAGTPLCDIEGLGFSSDTKKIDMPVVPQVRISVNGKALCLPKYPARSTNFNGYVDGSVYEVAYNSADNLRSIKIDAKADSKDVKVEVSPIDMETRKAVVKFTYKGLTKNYVISF